MPEGLGLIVYSLAIPRDSRSGEEEARHSQMVLKFAIRAPVDAGWRGMATPVGHQLRKSRTDRFDTRLAGELRCQSLLKVQVTSSCLRLFFAKLHESAWEARRARRNTRNRGDTWKRRVMWKQFLRYTVVRECAGDGGGFH